MCEFDFRQGIGGRIHLAEFGGEPQSSCFVIGHARRGARCWLIAILRTNGIPGLPGSNNIKVLEAGARKLGYKTVHTAAVGREVRLGWRLSNAV
jgi:hypothetical protein